MPKIKFKSKITIIIIVVGLILVLAHYSGLGNFTTRYISSTTNPLMRSAYNLSNSLADWLALYFGKSNLEKQNQELRQQLINLAKQNIELELIKQENEWLKQELEFVDNYEYDFVMARVLGRSLSQSSNNILIDKGSSAGLKPGLAITTNQGVIIGKIVKVEPSLSQVKLLIDNQSKLSVVVAGDQSALGVAHGQHNLNLKIEMLPKDVLIEPENLVATSGLDKDIPAGLLIGQVSKIETQEESLWQTALIEPAINYSEARLITVILGK